MIHLHLLVANKKKIEWFVSQCSEVKIVFQFPTHWTYLSVSAWCTTFFLSSFQQATGHDQSQYSLTYMGQISAGYLGFQVGGADLITPIVFTIYVHIYVAHGQD